MENAQPSCTWDEVGKDNYRAISCSTQGNRFLALLGVATIKFPYLFDLVPQVLAKAHSVPANNLIRRTVKSLETEPVHASDIGGWRVVGLTGEDNTMPVAAKGCAQEHGRCEPAGRAGTEEAKVRKP
jgi:hypothetical protein